MGVSEKDVFKFGRQILQPESKLESSENISCKKPQTSQALVGIQGFGRRFEGQLRNNRE